MSRNILNIVFMLLMLVTSTTTFAYDWSVVAKVKVVEPTYMPVSVAFQIDTAAGSCQVQAWMKWRGKGATQEEKFENSKAVLGVLTTALVSGRSVKVYGFNNECVAEYLHLL